MGLACPRPLRDAALKPSTDHFAGFVAHLDGPAPRRKAALYRGEVRNDQRTARPRRNRSFRALPWLCGHSAAKNRQPEASYFNSACRWVGYSRKTWLRLAFPIWASWVAGWIFTRCATRSTPCFNVQGVPSRGIMKLMRHSDLRLSSTTYTDNTCLPLEEVMKLNDFIPSPIASLNSDQMGQKEGKFIQTVKVTAPSEIVALSHETNDLADVVPNWENPKMAEREGFEPPVTFRPHRISSAAR